jgi:hypothetical protein
MIKKAFDGGVQKFAWASAFFAYGFYLLEG